MVTIDAYDFANRTAYYSLQIFHPSDSATLYSAGGQAFTNLNGVYKITSAQFKLYKFASPTGNAYARLYAIAGTYGTDAVPTGSALATSDPLDVSTITASWTPTYTLVFSGAQQYEMQPNIKYAIVFENPASGTIDETNYPGIGYDATTPEHSGNIITYRNSAWGYSAALDMVFLVTGDLVSTTKPSSGNITSLMTPLIVTGII